MDLSQSQLFSLEITYNSGVCPSYKKINSNGNSFSNLVIDDLSKGLEYFKNDFKKLQRDYNTTVEVKEKLSHIINNYNGSNIMDIGNKVISLFSDVSHAERITYKLNASSKRYIQETNISKLNDNIEVYRSYISTNNLNNDLQIDQLFNLSNKLKEQTQIEPQNPFHTIEMIINHICKLSISDDSYKIKLKESLDTLKEVFYNPNSPINKLKKNNFNELFPIDDYEKTINDIHNLFKSIYHSVSNSSGKWLTLADKFANYENNNKNLSEFIKNKFLDENKRIFFDFNDYKYKRLYILKDNSILLINKNSKPEALFSSIEARKVIKDIYQSYIKEKLKKHNTLCQFFLNKLNNPELKIVGADLCINTFLKNEQVLKLHNFSFLKQDPDTSFESLDDKMNSLILFNNVKKYAESIVSSKYKHLYTKESYSHFKELYDMGLSKDLLRDNIGKKLAAYKTPEEFNFALSRLVETYNSFNLEAIKAKADGVGAKTVFENDGILILQIDNFNQSKSLGSSSWCISRDPHYFSSYTENDNKQYFIYNFNKDSKDNYSMTGITLSLENNLITAHLKNDDYFDDSELRSNIIKLINQKPEIYNTTFKNTL